VWSRALEATARFNHGSEVMTLAFGRRARQDRLFFGGLKGFRTSLWRADDLRRYACAHVTRHELTDDEWRQFVGIGSNSPAC
jgi:hypothetical protein